MKIPRASGPCGRPVATKSTRPRPARSKIRICVAGARVWVVESRAEACRRALESLRTSQETWDAEAWKNQVALEIHDTWDGCSHGGRRHSKSRLGSACGDPIVCTGASCGHSGEPMVGHPVTMITCPDDVAKSACGDSARPVCGESSGLTRGDIGLDKEDCLLDSSWCSSFLEVLADDTAATVSVAAGSAPPAAPSDGVPVPSVCSDDHDLSSTLRLPTPTTLLHHGRETGLSPQVVKGRPLADAGDLKLAGLLGKGSCGKVYKCTWLGKAAAVKVKQVARQKGVGSEDVEIKILTKLVQCGPSPGLVHFGVVPLLAWRVRAGRAFLIFPCIPHDLKTLLSQLKQQGAIVSVQQAMRFTADVCSAGSHIHSLCILHRDIKPENILVRCLKAPPVASHGPPSAVVEPWEPVLCDFGNACDLSTCGDRLQSRRYGSLRYCAPEVLTPFYWLGHSYAGDVWSMGMVLAELESMMSIGDALVPWEQLLVIWHLCRPVAPTAGGNDARSLKACVKRLLLRHCPPPKLDAVEARGWPSGGVYGQAFGRFVRKLLQFNHMERASFASLDKRCSEALSDRYRLPRTWAIH